MYRISSQCGVAVAAAAVVLVVTVGLSCKWKQSVSILGMLSHDDDDDDDGKVNDSTTATYDAMNNSNQPKQQHNIVIVSSQRVVCVCGSYLAQKIARSKNRTTFFLLTNYTQNHIPTETVASIPQLRPSNNIHRP